MASRSPSGVVVIGGRPPRRRESSERGGRPRGVHPIVRRYPPMLTGLAPLVANSPARAAEIDPCWVFASCTRSCACGVTLPPPPVANLPPPSGPLAEFASCDWFACWFVANAFAAADDAELSARWFAPPQSDV